MRRSSLVTAPLLATAALAIVTGCAEKPCPPSQPQTACVAPSSQTIFGGFGRSFANNPWDWTAGVACGALFIWVASKGG